MYSFVFYHEISGEDTEILADSYEEALYKLKPDPHWILKTPEKDERPNEENRESNPGS